MISVLSSRKRFAAVSIATLVLLVTFFLTDTGSSALHAVKIQLPHPQTASPPPETPPPETSPPETPPPPRPKHKQIPSAAEEAPPVVDPFPLLAYSAASTRPPPVPAWNQARANLHTEYGLTLAPPLLIGFTRSWPMLLQAVVSYIAAGWPAEQIYVVENTGVQQANARGQLTLQNPFYLNHTTLGRLGVNVLQTPVLLSFAQLQNFYLSLTYTHGWPYYFWSHMDVLALSLEGGYTALDGSVLTGPYDGRNGTYKTVYELCLQALQGTLLDDGARWGLRFFAYDHLALVNAAAYEAIGGWDTLIPYYLTDCDLHARLRMANWSIQDRTAGIISDVSTILEDLSVLYRVGDVGQPGFVDPNPPPPGASEEDKTEDTSEGGDKKDYALPPPTGDDNLDKWYRLREVAGRMRDYKYSRPTRNTWQAGQHGGNNEPFYYPANGFAEAIDVVTEAGREVYRRKWGHRDCDLIEGTGLSLWDQWQVERDW